MNGNHESYNPHIHRPSFGTLESPPAHMISGDEFSSYPTGKSWKTLQFHEFFAWNSSFFQGIIQIRQVNHHLQVFQNHQLEQL